MCLVHNRTSNIFRENLMENITVLRKAEAPTQHITHKHLHEFYYYTKRIEEVFVSYVLSLKQ